MQRIMICGAIDRATLPTAYTGNYLPKQIPSLSADRGLEVLRWLSRKLDELEEPHVIVSDSLYPVGNEDETDDAVASLLSWPMREPCGFDATDARCVFMIFAGEVRIQ